MVNEELLGKKVIWVGKEECYGEGIISVVNPYHDGTIEYRENEHYKVHFKKMGVFVTIFKKHLVFI